MSPALAGRFLTSGPPGKSHAYIFVEYFWKDLGKKLEILVASRKDIWMAMGQSGDHFFRGVLFVFHPIAFLNLLNFKVYKYFIQS